MARMKRRWIGSCCRCAALAVLLVAPLTAQAREEEQIPDVYDVRLEGYQTNPTLPSSSTGLTWAAFVILGTIGCAGLFKDAKRSHLD